MLTPCAFQLALLLRPLLAPCLTDGMCRPLHRAIYILGAVPNTVVSLPFIYTHTKQSLHIRRCIILRWSLLRTCPLEIWLASLWKKRWETECPLLYDPCLRQLHWRIIWPLTPLVEAAALAHNMSKAAALAHNMFEAAALVHDYDMVPFMPPVPTYSPMTPYQIPIPCKEIPGDFFKHES
jgi:hypothetical protein